MVDSGHSDPAGQPVAELGFRNPVLPGLSMETFPLAELRRRVPAAGLAGPRRPDFHRILVITSGHGRQTVDFTDHDCRPGTLLWLRPHQVQQNTAAPGLEGRLVLFTEAFPPRSPALLDLVENRHDTAVWRMTPRSGAPVLDALRRLAVDYGHARRRAVATGGAGAPGPEEGLPSLEVELLRHQLGVLLLRIAALPLPEAPPRAATAPDGTYRRFRRELERHFGRTRRVEDYAHLLNCSAKTLNRACRAATGRPAKQVIDRRVVLEAQRLLVHTGLPAAAVARRLGFTEATNFGTFFTRHTGVPPGEFRARRTG